MKAPFLFAIFFMKTAFVASSLSFIDTIYLTIQAGVPCESTAVARIIAEQARALSGSNQSLVFFIDANY